MIKSFGFSLHFKNSPNQQIQKIKFLPGLNVIFGESGVGKSELINLISNKNKYESSLFNIDELNSQEDIKVILQNPDLQIISNSIENELAFSLECNSNNTAQIIQELEETKNQLLFSINMDRHPVTLSGGEKELLNISTTMMLPTHIILIDDALSFLSDQMKSKVRKTFFSDNHDDSIIIWFTSDENDLQYGDYKWELTSSSLLKTKSPKLKEFPKQKLIKGQISLNIDKINFCYEKINQIFTDYSESINSFRCLGINGNNGSGKSTLASLLLGLELPASGSIELSHEKNTNIEMGYLDQFPEKLLGIMTLEEFTRLLVTNGKLNSATIADIDSMLHAHNIVWKEIKNNLALDLSWTELRLSLIIILTNCNYDLLILDEPTFGMGTKQKNNLRTHFINILDEKHLILISHDHRFIGNICDTVIKL